MENREVSRLQWRSVRNNLPTKKEINYICFSKKDDIPWWGICYLDEDNNFRLIIDNLAKGGDCQEDYPIFPADYYIPITKNEYPEEYWNVDGDYSVKITI